MIIPTADNITKSHTFTTQNLLRNARRVMCLLLVLPLIACGSAIIGADPSGNDGADSGGLSLEDFLKTDTGKAAGKDDHLHLHSGNPGAVPVITDLAIESGTEANTIKITVKETIDYHGTKKSITGFVKTLSYTDPDAVAGRFMLKEGSNEWGQGLFSSNSDGSTVMGIVSEKGLTLDGKPWINHPSVVTGKEYEWDNVAKQSGLYTFGGKALTTAVGYKYESINSQVDKGQHNDVWFAMTLDIPTAAQAATKNLPKDADAILSITNWHLNDDINAADKNYLPLPALVSLKGGVGSNNLRLVKGDGINYIDERFLNFGTYTDHSARQAGNRKGRRFNKSEAETDFYKDVFISSITARLYGELGSLANKKAVIAGTYSVDANISGGDYVSNWGVYILKQY